MQNAVRTTIRIRKDLFDKSRLLAFNQGTSLQRTINDVIALGLSRISNLDSQKQAMAKIDEFRESLKDQKINPQALLSESKKDQK
ncbi:hypothetical protein HYU92_01160 [Candidatus Curtissbacteria bacterium]|nr:hypothetical protein [Candidatus Curtissbacteria bacterium]